MKDQSFTHGDITIEIHYDDCIDNPRYNENQTQFIMFHKTYKLPNESGIENYHEFFNSFSQMQIDLQSKFKHVNPVYMYNHSGLAFSLKSFHDQWDSGQIGFIVSNEGTSEEFLKNAESELITYGYYANGECFGYCVYPSEDEDSESQWGFYGYDHYKSGLVESLSETLRFAFEQNEETIQSIISKLK